MAASVHDRNQMFYNELKQTNDDLLQVVQSYHKKSPYYDFSETFKDYIQQIELLHKRFPPGGVATQANDSNATSLMNNSGGINNSIHKNHLNSPNSSGAGGYLFNDSKTNNNNTSTSTVIAAGAPTINNTFTTTSSIQHQIPNSIQDANTTQDNQTGEDIDEDSPPQPNVDMFEEPDALLQARCKLYTRSAEIPNSLPDLLGMGTLFIKPLETPTKLHLVIRQDPDLMKILLNLVITKSTIMRVTMKAVQLVVPEEKMKTSCYIMKFKDEKKAIEVYDKLRSVKNAQ